MLRRPPGEGRQGREGPSCRVGSSYLTPPGQDRGPFMPHSRSGGGGQGPASSMGASNQPRCSEVWAPQGSLCSLWPIFPAGDPEGPGTKAAGRSPPGAWMAGAALGWDIAKQRMDGPAAARTAPVRPVRNVLAQRLPCSAVESARGAPVLGPGPWARALGRSAVHRSCEAQTGGRARRGTVGRGGKFACCPVQAQEPLPSRRGRVHVHMGGRGAGEGTRGAEQPCPAPVSLP